MNIKSASQRSFSLSSFKLVSRFNIFLFAIVCAIAYGSGQATAETAAGKTAGNDSTPLQKVQATIDEIVEIVQQNSGDDSKDVRRQKLREVINPVFDFDEMAKRSLGPHWNKVTPEEQAEFVSVFSDLLAKTYLGKIETVKPGMVKVTKEKVDAPRAEVKTSVTNKGDTFPIDYKLQNTSGSWRVYDVEIENIGLVANYRNEFAGIIRKESFASLIERLKKKKEE
ncbi:MAG: ABC transporter substrate-binding protein [Deltaproteobacteria bacterium]|nr:ABC transporter substrate-binding protein [Deltaproteobacteria bacterium]